MTNVQSDSSPLRLLQVMLAPGDGGAETFFEKLAVAFERSGVEQRLVICRHPARRRRLEAAGCEVVEIPAQGWRKWLARAAVRRAANGYRPNVQFAWMNRAAGALSRRKGCVNIGRLGGYYPIKYYRRCDRLVGNTPSVLDHLGRVGWPSDRSVLISNFGDVPDGEVSVRDCRVEFGVKPDTPVVLTLGRLHENKGQDVLIRALAMLPEVVLLVAGEGGLRGRLEALASECGVAGRVRFLGWRRDVASLFKMANVCVFPSRKEPLGNVILEAWAHGLPVAAAASEGPSWLIDDGQTGVLFPVDDVKACADAAKRLLEDGELRDRCVAAGRRKWRCEFSEEVVVSRYLDYFGQVRASVK